MDSETLIWYKKPAENFNEALPIGNGRIGGMVFGGKEKEIIKLNEDSIWSGGKRNRNNPNAFEAACFLRSHLSISMMQDIRLSLKHGICTMKVLMKILLRNMNVCLLRRAKKLNFLLPNQLN